MQRWMLTLAYDGTPYYGWQIQPGLPTVQGTLAAALLRLTGETILPQGSGRTDTGVHALAQVASFDLRAPIPPASLHRALNRALPPSVRVLSAHHADPSFHARHAALSKTYEYRIFPRISPADRAVSSGHTASANHLSDRICPPTLAPYLWDCPWPLSLAEAHQAAQHILGTHDFTSFAAVDPDRTTRAHDTGHSPIRTIHRSCWHEAQGVLLYRVTGSGFLHHMVRNLVGTFVDAAAGRISPSSIPHILAARSRAAAGPTAPARGLFLDSVDYPPHPTAPPAVAQP